MTASTLTLTEFLLARIAEDEAMAKGDPRVTAHPVGAYFDTPPEPLWRHTCDSRSDYYLQVDPARVLAECEAKRAIIYWATPHSDPHPVLMSKRPGETDYKALTERFREAVARRDIVVLPDAPDYTSLLLIIALPYADHSDYRQEWRP